MTKQNLVATVRALQTPAPPADGVRLQLEKILASRHFLRSDRLTRFLRFAVEEALAGNGDQLKEQLIGIEVFDRGSDYDSRIDPIVRVEARRLRAKLKAFYTSSGREDAVIIGLPKGAYVPQFRFRPVGASPVQKDPAEKSIAVLPFSNLTPGPDDDYFSDGLTEELIHLLTRIPKLRVMAWTSASQLRGREQDLAGIRQQLKVDSVLRGSVRRTSGRVRVAAHLIDAESGAYLWSEAYDREIHSVFAIQEEMARAIVDTLQLTLGWQRETGAARNATNLECYNLCLQGRFQANKRTSQGLLKSVSCFEQAIAEDDSCAVAHAGFADAYSLLSDYGFLDPAETMPKARLAAEKALALDPQSAEAHVSLAFIRSISDWDWEGAEVLYRRAIALNPGYSRARHWFGLDHLALFGRFEEAKSEALIAHNLDPLSQIVLEGWGYIHMLCREYPSAVKVYQGLADLDPTFYKAHSSLGRVYQLMGRYDDAIAALLTARLLAGAVPSIISALGHTLALAGRTEEARRYLDELHAMACSQWVPSICFGIVHLGLGDLQSCLDYFKTACDRHEMAVTGFRVHPMYDPLRSEPRFDGLIRQVKLLP